MKIELQEWSLGDGFGDGRNLGLGFLSLFRGVRRREEERESEMKNEAILSK